MTEWVPREPWFGLSPDASAATASTSHAIRQSKTSRMLLLTSVARDGLYLPRPKVQRASLERGTNFVGALVHQTRERGLQRGQHDAMSVECRARPRPEPGSIRAPRCRQERQPVALGVLEHVGDAGE